MYISVPDQYPGRCPNYRQSRDLYGNFVPRRCLDYEGHQSSCRFEEDEPQPSLVGSSSYLSHEKPKPWVSPLY